MADRSQSRREGRKMKDSLLYREHEAEREEILKHKWIESEKAGRDVGFDQAYFDWILRHRTKWRHSRHPGRD